MRKLVCLLSVICFLFAPITGLAITNLPPIVFTAAESVAVLFAQDGSGSMRMRCTATAFQRTQNTYYFATASHCIGDDEDGYAADASYTPFYLSFDEEGETKVFYRAEAVAVGYQTAGDDIAVFAVTASQEWPVIALGQESLERRGSPFVNVSAPRGLGIQTFLGTISKLRMDRPIKDGSINWKDNIMLQVVGIAGGSSGSAIISLQQERIVGILVGSIGGNTIVAVPVSRLHRLIAQTHSGTYPYARPR
jgi:S1-C subfamily serine protease